MSLAALPLNGARLIEPEPGARPVTYRLATNADGPAIGRLFAAADYGDLGVDWQAANVANGWLVAEQEGEIVGAIQVSAGQPYGVLGACVVVPALRARDEAGHGQPGKPGRVTLTLYAVALKILKDTGSQMALGITDKPGLKRMLVRYGGVSLGPCESFAKVLR